MKLSEMNAMFAGALDNAFGLVGLGAIQPRPRPFILGCSCHECRDGTLQAIMADAHAQLTKSAEALQGFAQAVRPTRRAGRPYGYWQWNNGKLAPLFSSLDLPQTEDGMYTDTSAFYSAWDRSLGCFVSYAR